MVMTIPRKTNLDKSTRAYGIVIPPPSSNPLQSPVLVSTVFPLSAYCRRLCSSRSWISFRYHASRSPCVPVKYVPYRPVQMFVRATPRSSKAIAFLLGSEHCIVKSLRHFRYPLPPPPCSPTLRCTDLLYESVSASIATLLASVYNCSIDCV